MTQNPPHVVADELCGAELLLIIPSGWHLLTAKPIRLPGRDSEPEPDRCVVRGKIRDYEGRHPGPEDIAMVVEIADSSLPEDRKMAAAVYGLSGVPCTGSSMWSIAKSRSTPNRGHKVTGRAWISRWDRQSPL